jgi:hypothetical protein
MERDFLDSLPTFLKQYDRGGLTYPVPWLSEYGKLLLSFIRSNVSASNFSSTMIVELRAACFTGKELYLLDSSFLFLFSNLFFDVITSQH